MARINLGRVVGRDGKEITLQSNGTYLQWKYVGDENWQNLVELSTLNGADGNDGIGINNIQINQEGELVITYTNDVSSNLGIIVGRNGESGQDGRGIVSITKTDTEGVVDTYTINYTDNTTSTFTIINGSSGSGSSNYNELTNKPSIGNVELQGNKSLLDLGVQERLMSGTNIKTINNQSILGSGNITISSTNQNQWSGVTIDFMGDSITEGYPGGSTVTKKYWEFLGEKLNATVHGYGIGGSTIADGSNPMWSRVTGMTNADLIFVFGGTNDFAIHNRTLGDQFVVSNGTRTLNVNTSTFYGGLNKMCLNLLETFPNSSYVLLTPIHRKNFGEQKTDLQANTQGLYLDAYVDAIKNVGKWFSIPVIDLYSNALLYPQNETQKSLYFASNADGLHPNTLGHKVLSECIYNKLITIHKKESGVVYSISTSVTNGTSTGATSISNTGTTSITIVANEGYKLPTSVTVTGASYTYNENTGVVNITNATGNVIVSASCVALSSYTVTKNITGGIMSGADSIYENGTVELSVIPNEYYYMPETITVIGATYTYDKNAKTITISNPTENVTVTVNCEHRSPEVYNITSNVTGGISSGDTSIEEESTAQVVITPNNSYILPDSVTVVGATYSYDKSNGTITLSNPVANVVITVECIEVIDYSISTSVTNGTYSGDTNITNIGNATVIISPNTGYYLPRIINVTNASYEYDRKTGEISIYNAIGNVTISVECLDTLNILWYSDSVTDEFIGNNISQYKTWFATGPFVGKEIYPSLNVEHYPNPPQGSKINTIRFRAGKQAQVSEGGDGSLISGVNLIIGKYNTVTNQITYIEEVPITANDNVINSRTTISQLDVPEFTIGANEYPFVYTSDISKFSVYHTTIVTQQTVRGLYYQIKPLEVGGTGQLLADWAGNLGIDYGLK